MLKHDPSPDVPAETLDFKTWLDYTGAVWDSDWRFDSDFDVRSSFSKIRSNRARKWGLLSGANRALRIQDLDQFRSPRDQHVKMTLGDMTRLAVSRATRRVRMSLRDDEESFSKQHPIELKFRTFSERAAAGQSQKVYC